MYTRPGHVCIIQYQTIKLSYLYHFIPIILPYFLYQCHCHPMPSSTIQCHSAEISDFVHEIVHEIVLCVTEVLTSCARVCHCCLHGILSGLERHGHGLAEKMQTCEAEGNPGIPETTARNQETSYVLIPTNQILAWTPFWQEIFKLMANLLFVQALPSMQWTYEDWDVSFKINCLSSHLFLLKSVSRRTNQQRCFTLQTCEAVVLCMYSCFVLPSMQIYIYRHTCRTSVHCTYIVRIIYLSAYTYIYIYIYIYLNICIYPHAYSMHVQHHYLNQITHHNYIHVFVYVKFITGSW